MLIQILDANNKAWPMQLNMKAGTWSVDGARDPGSPFGLFAQGVSKRGSNGDLTLVTALWDLVLEAAPRYDPDPSRSSGTVRVSNSSIGPWEGGALRWRQSSAKKGAAADLLPTRTGDLRADIEATLRVLLPCTLGDSKWDLIQPGSKAQVEAKTYPKPGTSCLILPGFITQHFGATPHSWAFKGNRRNAEFSAYMNARSLSGTNRVRDQGKKFSAWIKADGLQLPKRGDIYVLLDRDAKGVALTDRDKDGVGHVGVVLNASASSWETADLGQGTGWDGSITRREYHAGIGELFGQANQPGATKFRVVAGWVNVDAYFPNYATQVAGGGF